jgi:hypothetical protein
LQRIDLFQTFDGREHRDRRGDDGIAIEQRCTDDAEEEDRASAAAQLGLGECHERQRAALALVVGPHDEDDVLERDHNDQRPDEQGYNADHLDTRRDAVLRRVVERFLQRVERAGADIAIDHADGAECQTGETCLALPVAMMVSIAGCLRSA